MASETTYDYNCFELIYRDYVQYFIGWVYLNLLMFDSTIWKIIMQECICNH